MKSLRAWRILFRLFAPASRWARLLHPRFDFSKSVLINANYVITDHESSKQRKHAVYLTSFTSSVDILKPGFHYWSTHPGTKSSPRQVLFNLNMHFHLLIGYIHGCNNISVQNVAIIKKCFTGWLFRLSVMLSKYMPYVCTLGYVLNYYTTCAASHNSQR